MQKFYLFISIIFFLTSCATKEEKLFAKLSKGDRKLEKYDGHFKISKESLTISKNKEEAFSEIGIASWYGIKKTLGKNSFHGKKTANGDQFNTHALTAAHKSLPIPSMAKITNLENNKSLIVMINDRGPYKKSRILDVSSEAAKLLGFKNKGLAKVKIESLPEETKNLLDKISLKAVHGGKPHGKIKQPKCSINCHVKMTNIKHGLKIE